MRGRYSNRTRGRKARREGGGNQDNPRTRSIFGACLNTTNSLIVTCLGLWQSAPRRNTYRVSAGWFFFSFIAMAKMMCLCARSKHIAAQRDIAPDKKQYVTAPTYDLTACSLKPFHDIKIVILLQQPQRQLFPTCRHRETEHGASLADPAVMIGRIGQ